MNKNLYRLVFNRALGVLHDARDIAAAHIGLHDDPPFAVLAADLVGPVGHHKIGHALQRDEPPARRRHRHLTQHGVSQNEDGSRRRRARAIHGRRAQRRPCQGT